MGPFNQLTLKYLDKLGISASACGLEKSSSGLSVKPHHFQSSYLQQQKEKHFKYTDKHHPGESFTTWAYCRCNVGIAFLHSYKRLSLQ